MIVYDKAKWHYGGDFPEDLDRYQAFVCGGMFLAWMIDRGFCGDEFVRRHQREICELQQRQLTGPKLYYLLDGVLAEDVFNEEGNRFAADYYKGGQYYMDYGYVLGNELETLYHVEDSWENYSNLAETINQRYLEWKAGTAFGQVFLSEDSTTSPDPDLRDESSESMILPGKQADFHSYMIVGKSEESILWQRETWQLTSRIFDPLICALGIDVAIRSTQMDKSGMGVQFGRLDWDEKSHEKWTHRQHAERLFGWTEIWVPGWNHCAQASPYLFMSIRNPFLTSSALPGQYNQLLQLSIYKQLHERLEPLIERVISGVARVVEAAVVATRLCPWLDDLFCVQDAIQNQFFYVGMEKDMIPSLDKINASVAMRGRTGWRLSRFPLKLE